MQEMDNEIMTTQEVADYLRLTEATVYKLAQAGELPAVKLGGSWRFYRKLLDDWLRSQSLQRVAERR